MIYFNLFFTIICSGVSHTRFMGTFQRHFYTVQTVFYPLTLQKKSLSMIYKLYDLCCC